MSVGGVSPRPIEGGANGLGEIARAPAGPAAPAARAAADATLADRALAAAFPGGALAAPLARGARGPQVTAIQYALGRLGHSAGLADGSYGRNTLAAVATFQREQGLAPSGEVDRDTLAAIDRALAAHDGRAEAARARDPLAFLSDFDARGLPAIEIQDRSRPIDWRHPEVQEAYGAFVASYWPVLKENLVEADCKTLALFFLDQFRAKMKTDTGVTLRPPGNGSRRVIDARFTASTAARPNGFFGRAERVPRLRPGYEAVRDIQRLDPGHSMLYGVNLRRVGMDAAAVARAATPVAPGAAQLDNRGDPRRAEVDLDALRPGDMIFIDHTGDGRYDHTVNVIAVERDPATGRAAKLTLAVGSFDHVIDADGATAPRGLQEVNNYCEEVEVTLGPDGKIASSQVTWSSEPDYVVGSRYSATSTLMELKPGGQLFVARWGES